MQAVAAPALLGWRSRNGIRHDITSPVSLGQRGEPSSIARSGWGCCHPAGATVCRVESVFLAVRERARQRGNSCTQQRLSALRRGRRPDAVGLAADAHADAAAVVDRDEAIFFQHVEGRCRPVLVLHVASASSPRRGNRGSRQDFA